MIRTIYFICIIFVKKRVLKCFVRVGSEFFLLALCVCVWGGGVRFCTSPSVKKITDPLLLINDWSL